MSKNLFTKIIVLPSSSNLFVLQPNGNKIHTKLITEVPKLRKMSRPVPPPRRVWNIVWQNFLKSFSMGYVRASSEGGGNYIATDYRGVKYFEKPADPSRGRRIATRYFEVAKPTEYYTEDLPSEWDSWLRHRRAEPPTEEEVLRNLQVAQMKKDNAAKLAVERGETEVKEAVPHKFPVYEEYEVNPGESFQKK